MNDPTIVIPFPQDGRPPAPAHLSPAEAETWRAVIGSKKAGHFGPEIFALIRGLLRDRIGVRPHRSPTSR